MSTTKQSDLINDAQSLIGATYGHGNYNLPVYDDGFGPLWIHRDSMGVSGIVRAKSFQDAYEICEDEFFPEADKTVEELIKEYGFKRAHEKMVSDGSAVRPARYPADYPNGTLAPELTFVHWKTVETPDPEAWIENEMFQEAFGFRPNGPNERDIQKHGVFAKDLNGDSLELLTAELIEDLYITLNIREEGEESI